MPSRDYLPDLEETLIRLLHDGFLTEANGGYRITPEGLLACRSLLAVVQLALLADPNPTAETTAAITAFHEAIGVLLYTRASPAAVPAVPDRPPPLTEENHP